MKREIISCDECGAEKKDNNWYNLHAASLVTTGRVFCYLTARAGDSIADVFVVPDSQFDYEQKDLCSEECLQKAEFRLRGKMRGANGAKNTNDRQPST